MTTPERLAKVAKVLHDHLGCARPAEHWPSCVTIARARGYAEALRPLLDEFAAQDYAAGAASVIAYPEQALAEAWDEGFDAGERDVFEHEHQERGFDTPCIANPYRTPQTHATAPLSDAQPERESDSHRHGNGAQNGREDAPWDWLHAYHAECPACREVKFIGHGPLCLDCFTNRAAGEEADA